MLVMYHIPTQVIPTARGPDDDLPTYEFRWQRVPRKMA